MTVYNKVHIVKKKMKTYDKIRHWNTLAQTAA